MNNTICSDQGSKDEEFLDAVRLGLVCIEICFVHALKANFVAGNAKLPQDFPLYFVPSSFL